MFKQKNKTQLKTSPFTGGLTLCDIDFNLTFSIPR